MLSVILVGAFAFLPFPASMIRHPPTCSAAKYSLSREKAGHQLTGFLGCSEAGLSIAMYSSSFLSSVSGTGSSAYSKCFPGVFSNTCMKFTAFQTQLPQILRLMYPKETNTKIKWSILYLDRCYRDPTRLWLSLIPISHRREIGDLQQIYEWLHPIAGWSHWIYVSLGVPARELCFVWLAAYIRCS